ncbi:cytochrome P450 family protein [Abortiporus biennis]
MALQDNTLLLYGGVALVVYVLYRFTETSRLSHIPTLGWSLPILSYLDAFKLVKLGKYKLQEGYEKYKGHVFKIATLDRWFVVISGPQLVEEVRKLPDETVSFMAAVHDLIQTKYTIGQKVDEDPWHVEIIKAQLTRQIAGVFPDVRDEIVASFADLIPPSNEWMPVPALDVMRMIVARVSSRAFVGLPLCRNMDYLNIAIYHTIAISEARNQFTLLPEIFKPVAAPFINERIDMLKEYGENWADKPNDMLMWILETGLSRGADLREIVEMLLATDFAAIHTSSNSFAHALYHLAANPEYIQPLRDEVESVIGKQGWSKTAMTNLRKIDSFMKESMRMNGINGTSIMRKAMRNFTLSDGTYIPKDTILVAPSNATHTDEENYSNAHEFLPFRFSDIRDEDGEGTKHHFVSTSADYISFGHGKHACPGRFFAANELKAMLAHIVLNYDVKFEHEGVRPENVWFGTTLVPAPTAKVLFRKRQTS